MGVLYELVINLIVLYASNCIRILIFKGIEILICCKVRPINLRTGTKAPVLKIEKAVLNELVINLIVLYASNCIRILIFKGIEVLICCKVRPINLRTGTKAPVLKIEKAVLNELVINLIVLYASNCIRILIFKGIEVLICCKVRPINLRTGTKAPVLKIEKAVLNELVINLIVFYASNCIRILIFKGIEVLICCKVSLISWRTGNEPPVLKIAFRGILQLGSVSHRFLRFQTTYVWKVSCWYQILHDWCVKLY